MDGVETEEAVYEVSELRQQIEKLLTDKKNKRSETPDICRKRKAGEDECKDNCSIQVLWS